MKLHYRLISATVAVTLVLSGCSNVSTVTREQATLITPLQTDLSTATPSPTYTLTAERVFPAVTKTFEPTAKPQKISSATPEAPHKPLEPTQAPPSLNDLQIINRTNAGQIVPIWRYEPKDNLPESRGEEFAFHPDGKTIAFSVGDHVEMIDLELGQTVQTFSLDNLVPEWAEQKVYSLAFHPDGKRLAGLTEVGVILWDVSSEKPLWITEREEDSNEYFTKMIFSPGGDTIITTSAAFGSDIRVWSSETGKQIKALQKPNQLDAVFNEDGSRLITVDRVDNVIRAWDTQTWTEVDFPKELDAYVTLTISSNGKLMAVNTHWNGEGEDMTQLYLVDDWKYLGFLYLPNEEGYYYGPTRIEPSFNSDGGILALAVANKFMNERPNHVELWDTSSLNLIASLNETFPAPITWVSFSPDGRILAARSEDGTTIFWGVPSLEPFSAPGPFENMEIIFTQPGKPGYWIKNIYGNEERKLAGWWNTGGYSKKYEQLSFEPSPAGEYVLFYASSIMDIWSPEANSFWVNKLDGSQPLIIVKATEQWYPQNPIWSTDGKQIAYRKTFITKSDNGELITGKGFEIWIINTDGSGEKKIFSDPELWVQSFGGELPLFRWLNNGYIYFSLHDPGALYVLNPIDGTTYKLLDDIQSISWSVSISPDGQHVRQSSNVPVGLIQQAGMVPVEVPLGDQPLIWSADGKKLVYQAFDPEDKDKSNIVLHDLTNGNKQEVLKLKAKVTLLGFSPGDRYIAYKDETEALYVFDLTTNTIALMVEGQPQQDGAYTRFAGWLPTP